MSESDTKWVCSVCGYAHHGDEPPDACPQCGAPKSAFELQEEAPSSGRDREQPQQWHCLICGYIHDGPEPPEECPICGASQDDFEAYAGPSDQEAGGKAAAKVVIVGAGVAGVSAAEAVREMSDDCEVVLVSKEPDVPYRRLNLTRFVAGEVQEDELYFHDREWYESKNIRLLLDTEVTAINLDAHEVVLDHGDAEGYEKLILACGAHPFIPPIHGATREGVSSLRTIEQAKALISKVEKGMKVVCIGGGILGLETAGGLAEHGADVTLLEAYGWLMPRQLNEDAAAVLKDYVEELGIKVESGVKVKEIIGDEAARGVRTEDGDEYEAVKVIITAGVRANSYLARTAGLEVDRGIIVDSHLRCSDSDIYAAGDVAQHNGIVYGLWEPARYMGVIAGRNAAGASDEFGGLPRLNTLKVLGLELFSIGLIAPEDGSYQEIVECDGRHYQRYLFHDNKLAGAILLGDTKAAGKLTKAYKNGMDFSDVLQNSPSVEKIVRFVQDRA